MTTELADGQIPDDVTEDTSEQAPRKVLGGFNDLHQMSGLSTSFLRRLAKEDRLPGCRRLGWRYICHLEEFEEWFRSGGKEWK